MEPVLWDHYDGYYPMHQECCYPAYQMGCYEPCGNRNFVLIVVLFILLIIVGASAIL
ncbi:YjcZ family sporulation protein [Scopulibacillus cellulosilyticus]|uniref:YjcZ family sporulation protein n=1 Tax=Scopulibacillus cellulosilyticus TaxID=2665665 RepID=A0ABW2PUU3_9BACL